MRKLSPTVARTLPMYDNYPSPFIHMAQDLASLDGHLIAPINLDKRTIMNHDRLVLNNTSNPILTDNPYVVCFRCFFFSIEHKDLARDRYCYGFRLPEEPGWPKEPETGL